MRRKRYRDRTAVFASAIVAYVFIANTFAVLGANRAEVFPFFNWSLFTNATGETRYDVAVYIEKLEGRTLPQPTLVYDLKGELKGIGDGINLRKATKLLAVAIVDHDRDKVSGVRRMIERTYLRGPERLSYSVWLISYKPLERYRTGKVTPLRAFGRFEKGE